MIEHYTSEILLILYIAIQIACCVITAYVQSYLAAKAFIYVIPFPQWVIPLFSLMFAVFITLLYGWLKYFTTKCNYVPNFALFASFLFIEGVSIAMGFVYNKLLGVDSNLIWTSFVILPAVIATFLVFLANWQSNDYFFYQQKK